MRTLALAYKKLDESEFSAWNNEFMKAKSSIGGDREANLERISDIMEKDLILIGATAVEDKLQNGVCLFVVSEVRVTVIHLSLHLSYYRCLNALINLPKLVSSSGFSPVIKWKLLLILG